MLIADPAAGLYLGLVILCAVAALVHLRLSRTAPRTGGFAWPAAWLILWHFCGARLPAVVAGGFAAVLAAFGFYFSSAQFAAAIEVQRAETPADAERLWQARRSAGGAVARLRPNNMVEDATVPVKNLPEMIRRITALAEKYHLMIGVLAHAGDGNLHPLIMFDSRDKEEVARIDQALDELFAAAIELGGTLSGEHGIGIAKMKWMELEYSPRALEIMRGIKKVFDPNNILNPGSFL